MSVCHLRALPALDLSADVVTLTAALCDIESVSQDEAASSTPSRPPCARSAT